MRKIKILFVLTIVMIALASCATWQKDMTRGYEAAGVLGTTYYSVAKTSCDQKAIPADRCEQLRKINNDARSTYQLAGNTLILAIQVDDAVEKNQFLVQYNTLMSEFNKLLLQFVTVLRELKVL